MVSFSKEFDLNLDNHALFTEDLEDGEQNLEDEANEMVKSWNRDDLIREIADDREKIKRDNENRSIDYYDGETNFDDIASKMDPLEGGEVLIKILEPNPSGKLINGSHSILFDRIGYLEHELTPFESSIYDGRPTKLSLIEGPVLPGMLQALISLREGERANILIRPSMAYGRLGCIPLIPEDSTLFYHIKIYKVWEESQLNCVLDYERANMTEFPIEQKLSLVEEHKSIANSYLHDDQPREALIRYKAAIKCLDEVPPEMLERSNDVSKLMLTLLHNAAITYNKLGMYKSATKTAKRALSMDPTSTKAYYQLAKARIGVSDYSGALKWIEKACQISPNSTCFDHLRVQLDFQYRDEKKKRDDIMTKMSKACK